MQKETEHELSLHSIEMEDGSAAVGISLDQCMIAEFDGVLVPMVVLPPDQARDIALAIIELASVVDPLLEGAEDD